MATETTPQEDYNDLMDLYIVAGEATHGIWYHSPGDDNLWAFNGLRGDFLINRGYTPDRFYELEDKVVADLGQLSIFADELKDASPADFDQ